ncbi:putative retrotransposon protein [Tanacetum coccineum]
MYDNKVWRLVVLPPNAKVVKSKWIYKKKTDMDGKPIAAFYDYEIWQMDVKTAFLNGFLEEEIYMEQPKGFIELIIPGKYAVGSIMYAVRYTRPDVAFAQNITCRFQQNFGEAHFNCYCDAGFETDRDDTKSQTGYVFVLNGGAVVWKSSKQSTTAQHATEAEYIAASEAAKEVVWIRKFIDELGVVPSNDYPIKMNCDNSAAIIMAKESGIQKGARHFKRKYHYVRECIETGEIDIVKVHTDDNLADPFTKALAGPKLTRHARSMGLRPASSFM